MASMHISELTREINLTIRGIRGFKVRFWIARKIFLLGAWVAGMGISFED